MLSTPALDGQETFILKSQHQNQGRQPVIWKGDTMMVECFSFTRSRQTFASDNVQESVSSRGR